jgi:hypothetical protein
MEPIYCSSSSVLRCIMLTASNTTHYFRAEGVVCDQQNVTFIDIRSVGCALAFRNTTVRMELRHNKTMSRAKRFSNNVSILGKKQDIFFFSTVDIFPYLWPLYYPKPTLGITKICRFNYLPYIKLFVRRQRQNSSIFLIVTRTDLYLYKDNII